MIRHNTGVQVGYASGNFGKAIVWSSLDYFFLFVLTNLWGLSGTSAGLIILISLIWDGLLGPLVGVLVDRRRARFGKYGPWIAAGAPLCGLAFWWLLQDPGLREDDVFWRVLFVALVFRTTYAVCDVAHNALMTRISLTPNDAAFVSGIRFVFSSLGSMVVAVTAGHVFSGPDSAVHAERAARFALAAGLIYTASLWIAWLCTARLDMRLPDSSADLHLQDMLRRTLSNQPFLLLMGIALAQATCAPIFAKALSYYATYVVESASWVGGALLLVTAAQAISMPLWILICRQRSSTDALMLSYLAALLSLAGFASLYPGPSALSVFWLIGIGIAFGGMNMALWAVLPPVIQADIDNDGRRTEAMPTGLFLLALKLAAGLSASVFGITLDAIGLGAAEPGDVEFGQRLIATMTVLPAFGLIAAFAMVGLLSKVIGPATGDPKGAQLETD